MTKMLVNFRIEKNSYELIKARAKLQSKNISDYIRDQCLKDPMWIEKSIKEIHNILTEKGNNNDN